MVSANSAESRTASLLKKAGFDLVKALNTSTNGASLLCIAKKGKFTSALFPKNPDFGGYQSKVIKHRQELFRLIVDKKPAGYGASTKGNVVLQYCDFGPDDIPYIAEINPSKFGRVTPGSQIPIIPETEAFSRNPESFLVFPWHFEESILKRHPNYKGDFIFPFPNIHERTNRAIHILQPS